MHNLFDKYLKRFAIFLNLYFRCTKYAHDSHWPAFTETVHKDSVTKKDQEPGALKVNFPVSSWNYSTVSIVRFPVGNVEMAWDMSF